MKEKIIGWTEKYKNELNTFGGIASIISLVLSVILSAIAILYEPFRNFIVEIFSYSEVINIIFIAILGIGIYLVLKEIKNKRITFGLGTFIVAIIFLGVVLLGVQTYNIYDIKDKTAVVISEFDDKGNIKVDIAKRIDDSLTEESNKLNLSSIKIERSSKIIHHNKEVEEEGKKGIRKNAKVIIVIWGWGDDMDIKTSFNVVKAPEKDVVKTVELEKSKGETIEDIKNFNLTYIRKTLPDAMIFLTHITLGTVYYYERNYENAIFQFNTSLKNIPEDEKLKESIPEIYLYMGNSYYFQGNYIYAEREYKAAIKINSNYAEAHYNLATVLYNLKSYEEAEKELREAIRINSYYAEAHNNLGVLLYNLKRYEEAEKEYRKAIKINPNFAEAHNNLGILLADLNRYEEAEKEFREAIKINPNDAGAHYNLGVLLKDLNRYEEAEKEFREAIKINPNFAGAHNNLGNLLQNLKRYEEAEKEYREAIKINPNFAEAHNNLGVLLTILNRYDEAEKEYREAIRINPNYAEAHINLGILLHNLNRYEEAEKEYRETIRINPDDAKAHTNLGILYVKIGRTDDAKEEILKAKELYEKQGRTEKVKICDEILKDL